MVLGWLFPESFWLNCVSFWTEFSFLLAQSWVLLTELCVFLTESWGLLAQSSVLVTKSCFFLTQSWVLLTESRIWKDIRLQTKATNSVDCLIFACAQDCALPISSQYCLDCLICAIFFVGSTARSFSRTLSITLEFATLNPRVVAQSSRGEGDPSVFQVGNPSNWRETLCLHPVSFWLLSLFLNTHFFQHYSELLWSNPEFQCRLHESGWLNPESCWLNPGSFWLHCVFFCLNPESC